MLKWVDIPPVWLLGFLAVGYFLPVLMEVPGWLPLLGGLLIAIGVGLILWAVVTMFRSKTTVNPHLQPGRLVTSGPFRFSRNPIYLGDALLLAGCLLIWGHPWALPMVPLFMWIISRRFIRGEERRLRDAFGMSFSDYGARTRRWI